MKLAKEETEHVSFRKSSSAAELNMSASFSNWSPSKRHGIQDVISGEFVF